MNKNRSSLSMLISGAVFASLGSTFLFSTALAGPNGAQIQAGSANVAGQGTSTVTITQSSQRVVIDWASFDTNAGENVHFSQPNSNAIAVNRILGGSPTQFDGNLSANGKVVLINSNGVIFGNNAKVDVGGLIATTANATNDSLMNDAAPLFNQAGDPNARIINNGTITVKDAGLAGFVAPHIENNNVIEADIGKVQLASGNTFTLDLAGDDLVNIAISDDIAAQVVKNAGRITGNKVAITAAQARDAVDAVINNSGVIEATNAIQKNGIIILSGPASTIRNSGILKASGGSIHASGKNVKFGGIITTKNNAGKGGKIEILAEKHVELEKAALDSSGQTGGGDIRIGGGYQGGENLLRAKTTFIDGDTTINADAVENGNGGSVVVWADDYTDYAGAISSKGGLNSGNGGNAEVSGKKYLNYAGTVNLLAGKGHAGTLLLDPQNITIQTTAASPAVDCTSGVCIPTGDSSILTVSALQNALNAGNVTISTGSFGVQAGDIVFANSLSWNNNSKLIVNAYRNITINSGVTITNTYTGTFGASEIPVLLTLRADAAGINNGGDFINNGTINFSGSRGAVSMYYDRAVHGGSYTAGTQTANGSWTAPANRSVNTQFTAYQLVNTVTDLAAINSGLSGNYALGKDIDGGGAIFNSSTPMGTLTGVLDGQYCQVSGGSACSITNLSMTPAGTTTAVGMFSTIGTAGRVRNLILGLNVTQNYTAAMNNVNKGVLAALNQGTIANVTATGSMNYTYTGSTARASRVGGVVGENSGTLLNVNATTGAVNVTSANTGTSVSTIYAGGIVGYQSPGGTLTNSTSSKNVNFIYQGTSTGTNVTAMGGLIGYNNSTTANSVINSSASGDMDSSYAGAPNSTGIVSQYIGGAIGWNGNNAAVAISGISASGDIKSRVQGTNSTTIGSLSVYLGGLVGYMYSTLPASNLHATGDIDFSANSGAIIGGLIGYQNHASGHITTASATGSISSVYTGTAQTISFAGGLMGVVRGNLTDVTTTGTNSKITATNQNSGTNTFVQYAGGISSYQAATSKTTNAISSVDIEYIQKGTSSANAMIYAGGLVGYNVSIVADSVVDSNASGDIDAHYFDNTYNNYNAGYFIGGAIGRNGTATATPVTRVSASGNVSSNLQGTNNISIGGLIGYHHSTSPVSGSYATGNVNYSGNTKTWSGGLVGYSTGGITTSYATGNVTNTFTGPAPLATYLGGLVGETTANISNSYATGNLGTTGSADFNLGGLAGRIASSTVSDTYALGMITSANAGTDARIGGLVGDNAAGNITTSYAAGYINTNVTSQVGGLVGVSTGTVANASTYWNTETTGLATSAGGTGITTENLQSGLPSGFSGTTWGIIADVSYPYLLWQESSGIPQFISGRAYSDYGTTGLAGELITARKDGNAFATVYSGANGYYYFMLPSGTISAGGSQVMTYLTGTTKGLAFKDTATTNIANLDIFGNSLNINSANSSLAAMLTNLATAQGSLNGADTPYINDMTSITMDDDISLKIEMSGLSVDLDRLIKTNAVLILESENTVTQTSAIEAAKVLFLGAGGSYTLDHNANNIGTIAADTGDIELHNGAHDLTIGRINDVDGVNTTGAVKLLDYDTLTADEAIYAGGGSTSILLSGQSFVNNFGTNALNPGTGGHFQVWSDDPANDDRNGQDFDFKQYNATYGTTTVAGTGNGFLYSLAPVINISLQGNITKTFDNNADATLDISNYVIGSGIDGDVITPALPLLGTYNNPNVGKNKNVFVSGIRLTAQDNSKPVYGYQFNTTTNANIGVINAVIQDIVVQPQQIFGINGIEQPVTNNIVAIDNDMTNFIFENEDMNVDTETLIETKSGQTLSQDKAENPLMASGCLYQLVGFSKGLNGIGGCGNK